MMPGRSLLAKAIGRSMAPVARMTCLARTFHRRWRGAPARAGRVMIGDALEQHDVVVVPVADRGGARQHVNVLGGRRVRRPSRAHPVGERRAVDTAAGDIGDAAEARILVGDDDAGTGCRRGLGRGEAGDAGADHQHVAMDVDLLVGVGIAALRRAAEAGGAADHRLVDVLPERAAAT